MLASHELGSYLFSSIHEPCPADVSIQAQKQHDYLISSENEDNRQMGVRMIRRSLNLACDLGAKMVVVHSGSAGRDQGIETRLRELFDAGQQDGSEYLELKERIIYLRRQQIGPRFAAVQKSLRELLEYAAALGIQLCLENRYHYMDIPGQAELQTLLELADNDRLGFQYDTGHAQALDRLGFYKQEEWLKRYSQRILGTHLHDARGVHDHQAPGLGEVDFAHLAPYLPSRAVRTIEISPHHTPGQIQTGLQVLLNTGCINKLSS
jgi:sugar phosphate isomerase/epimerase